MCYYYGTKFDHMACVVEHCQEKHQHNILKYRQLILDEHSGTLKYQTKIHEGVVPYDLFFKKLSEERHGLFPFKTATVMCADKFITTICH